MPRQKVDVLTYSLVPMDSCLLNVPEEIIGLNSVCSAVQCNAEHSVGFPIINDAEHMHTHETQLFFMV